MGRPCQSVREGVVQLWVNLPSKYKMIPAKYQADLAALAGTKFSYTEYSFTDIVKSTEKRALLVVEKAGGKVTASEVVIPRPSRELFGDYL